MWKLFPHVPSPNKVLSRLACTSGHEVSIIRKVSHEDRPVFLDGLFWRLAVAILTTQKPIAADVNGLADVPIAGGTHLQ